MKLLALVLVFMTGPATPLEAGAEDCQSLTQRLKLPLKAKLEGKPRQVRWNFVEKTLTRLREEAGGCHLSFEAVFNPPRPDVYFPLIGNLLRTVPEESLKGATVYSQSGRSLGTFANRVVFNKRGEYNYSNYYFQFLDSRGELQSSGNRLLIDVETAKPFFLLKWEEIKGRTLMAAGP